MKNFFYKKGNLPSCNDSKTKITKR